MIQNPGNNLVHFAIFNNTAQYVYKYFTTSAHTRTIKVSIKLYLNNSLNLNTISFTFSTVMSTSCKNCQYTLLLRTLPRHYLFGLSNWFFKFFFIDTQTLFCEIHSTVLLSRSSPITNGNSVDHNSTFTCPPMPPMVF